MASVIRNKTNLSKLNSAVLKAIVATCLANGVDAEEFEWAVDRAQFGRTRADVIRAAVAYDILQNKLSQAHIIEASEESRLWSSLEGGHRFILTPHLDVLALMRGEVREHGKRTTAEA